MADIDVAPKNRSYLLWVWVIIAIVLAVILLAWMGVLSLDSATQVGELINGSIGVDGVEAIVT